MKRLTIHAAVAIVLIGTAAAPRAQAPSALDQELRRIFQSDEYSAESFGPAVWFGDGSYGVVERVNGTRVLVAYDAATGKRDVLADAALLTPKGASAPLAVANYQWVPAVGADPRVRPDSDRKRALIFTNTKRVWRQNTRGDYWLLDREARTLQKIGAGAPESALMFAKVSPDGARVAYVRERNLYVEDLAKGDVRPLTADGSETIVNGTSDWVNEEEFGIRDGFRWSPDGRSLAYWQFDTSGVEQFTLINDTDALYPKTTKIPYPKPGTTNSAVRIGVVDAVDPRGGATRWMKTPGDHRNTYLASLQWTADSRSLLIQQLNRVQNTNDLLVADAKSGDVHRAYRDSGKAWVERVDDVIELDRGRAVTWASEQDGWRHLYKVALDGSGPWLLTKFDGDVIDVLSIDVKNGWAYFIASPESAIERFLYRVRLDGNGAIERVTPAGQHGTHGYQISGDGRWAFHTFSRADTPPAVDLVSLPDHRVVRTLATNTSLASKVAPLVTPATDFFKMDVGGGVVLDGSLTKPRTFDASKKYPLIVYVYGEPASVTVVDRWGGSRALFHHALANEGYVVASFDNRGTPAPKGAAWRKVVYGTVGDLSSKEQAAAVRAFAAANAWVDRDRIGVWGWSGGGSNTLNCMFRFPEVFKVGVSVAPVPDQRLYDTIYQERYMGVPQDNAEGYRIGSPINFAAGLSGKLLVVHGSGDDNVHYQGTERLVNRLVELGKPFDLMVYPNRTHGISEGAGTSLHVQSLIARYFLEHLPAGPR
jgi:dipeptidyl-peptidase 4